MCDRQVDRSVTGLVAQQQCVGPLHTPLADVAVIAASYFSKVWLSVTLVFHYLVSLSGRELWELSDIFTYVFFFFFSIDEFFNDSENLL